MTWVAYIRFFLFCFSVYGGGGVLQVRHPTPFVPNSLSIPFTEDRRQVLLDRHLLSVAAVAVCEDPIRVPLGEGLRAVLQGVPTAACERQTGGTVPFTCRAEVKRSGHLSLCSSQRDNDE